MILFRCDYCNYEVDNGDLIQAADILQGAMSKAGNKRKDAGSLLAGSKEKHFCNRCYEILLEWVESDLRTFIRDNFPLEKK